MKSIIKKGSCKLGGLLFKHKDFKYYDFHDWVEKGCPPNSYVRGTPDQLIICGIPIVDGRFDSGVFHKITPEPLQECSWKIPYYMSPKPKNESKKVHYDFITFFDISRKAGPLSYNS